MLHGHEINETITNGQDCLVLEKRVYFYEKNCLVFKKEYTFREESTRSFGESTRL